MSTDSLVSAPPDLLETLAGRVGTDAVITEPRQLALVSHDIFLEAETPPLLVFAPDSTEKLSDGLRVLHEAGCALAPRGGGMSYTGGYLASGRWACVDLSRMTRIVEINTEDRYLTAEAGCTWAQVHHALAETGLMTPYGGPLSGLRATVGGALSQNSLFFGAGQHGTAADHVLGLEVVLADGERLCTGSAASGAPPFARWGGPDLTALFVGDNGAFGIKATATLPLLPRPASQGYASFGFPDMAAMVNAQVALIRAGLGSETFGIDAYKARNSAQTGNKLADGVRTLTEIARKGPSLLSGLKAAAGVAMAGTDYLAVHPYSIHLALDGDDAAHVQRRLARVTQLCAEHGGVAQAASVPQVLRAQPFQPLRSVLAHNGDRWVPVHGILPLSQALPAVQAVEALLEREGERMREHGIVYSPLTANLDRAFVFEPCFYWPDAIYPLHTEVLGSTLTAPWADRPRKPEASKTVRHLWQQVAACLQAHGAVHMQIGRAYPYLQRLEPRTRALLQALKLHVDPTGLMNPGSLGLGRQTP